MKRSIRTPLALFGLLLAFVMVCTAWAQSGARPTVRPWVDSPTAGRYQPAWTGSALLMADTATGECWIYNGKTWGKFAPSLDQARAANNAP
jgi:hypothetical protein